MRLRSYYLCSVRTMQKEFVVVLLSKLFCIDQLKLYPFLAKSP
jgi:hypothetical protein